MLEQGTGRLRRWLAAQNIHLQCPWRALCAQSACSGPLSGAFNADVGAHPLTRPSCLYPTHRSSPHWSACVPHFPLHRVQGGGHSPSQVPWASGLVSGGESSSALSERTFQVTRRLHSLLLLATSLQPALPLPSPRLFLTSPNPTRVSPQMTAGSACREMNSGAHLPRVSFEYLK